MKAYFLQTSFLALLQTTSALVGISWKVSNTSSTGLQDITFPISMPNAAHKSGYYYAQQFSFINQKDVGYTGLQPREDNNSNSIVHAAFSSFVAGTTSSDENCSDGADGGAGVSCAVDVSSSYEHGYLLRVKNTGGTTWAGTLIDEVDGTETHIGSYTLPDGSGGIAGSQVGFVEYYPWNSGSHTCDQLPKTEVTFGVPSSSGGDGELDNAYEYGDCVGKVDFSSKRVDGDAVDVVVGF
ncbi:uncharacterized protein N7469_004874 [Penicillium citrinum]|uniref:Uncharacterized protein n=2 Tax=Penicillium TaxID=5073 RepID=A0A9W9P5L5_PENCI|nr:uncharacterized protein N7469_004874 [Penicillium citrinum]KAJ5235706.1 hypothetical protein N7469_004874 [Penicillium citrinum]KAJ5591269.1 hypothetical protein N7450_005241 [Penicillium hetheringtonii]KAK5799946.1 hypothetical protein VI817_002158 [Penicillium citrinum]